MEKMKVNFDMEFEKTTKTIQDKNGNDVVIWNWIPYGEKEALVQELTGYILNADDDLGVCYEVLNYDLFYNYVIVKYYTNIDVEDIQDIDGFRKLYDYCDKNGFIGYDIDDFLNDDLCTINRMIVRYKHTIMSLYEEQHSLSNIVKKLLGTDFDANNAETRELIEKLIDMKGALMEKEEENKVLAFGKKKPVGLKTGGVKMNLAKR